MCIKYIKYYIHCYILNIIRVLNTLILHIIIMYIFILYHIIYYYILNIIRALNAWIPAAIIQKSPPLYLSKVLLRLFDRSKYRNIYLYIYKIQYILLYIYKIPRLQKITLMGAQLRGPLLNPSISQDCDYPRSFRGCLELGSHDWVLLKPPIRQCCDCPRSFRGCLQLGWHDISKL